MKKYKINEIFYSPQGEGARSGSMNVFIRFSGCDMTCGFCDTEFESGIDMKANEIVQRVVELMPEPRSVILTGGEPALQYDEELQSALEAAGAMIAIETNGGTKLKARTDWISISPKVAEHVVETNFPEGASELRYVRHLGQAIPSPKIYAAYYYLSPEFRGNMLQRESFDHCLKLVKENPKWRLSVQQHKLWGVR